VFFCLLSLLSNKIQSEKKYLGQKYSLVFVDDSKLIFSFRQR